MTTLGNFSMAYIARYIRFFVVMIVCLNSKAMLSSDRTFDPYSSSPTIKPSNMSLRFMGLSKSLSGISHDGSILFLSFLDKSYVKMHDAYDLTSKVITENPRQVSAVAAAATILALAWYKRESIKEYCKTEHIEKFKERINNLGGSAVEIIDNQIKKLPPIVQPLPLALKGVIAWFYRKLLAMEGEYVVGALMSPLIGYINSWTPFAAFGGVKLGCAVAGGFWIRGWMGIDAAEIKREVNKVGKKVDGVQDSVNNAQVKANENHEVVLKNIEDLDNKISQLSLDIKQEIEESNETLGKKIESSATQAEESRNVLKKNIESVHNELSLLAEQVSQLPSKKDNQNVVDDAMAKTIKSFEDCIANSVEVLDKKTEEKLAVIKQQLREGFEKIDGQQKDQANKIKKLADQVSQVIDEREQDIKALTDLVDSTKISHKVLLEKFDSIEDGFTKTQKALKENDAKYTKLLEEKAKDWLRLEEKINEQIQGFSTINQKLSELQKNIVAVDQKIDAVEQKTDNQYEQLNTKMDKQEDNLKLCAQQQEESLKLCMQQMEKSCNSAILSLKEELVKTQKEILKVQEDADKERKASKLREELYLKELEAQTKKISALEEAQNKQGEKVDLLRDDLKINAEKVHKGQTEILDAIKNGSSNPQITYNSSAGNTGHKKLLRANNSQSPHDIQQLLAQKKIVAIDWSAQTDQNNT